MTRPAPQVNTAPTEEPLTISEVRAHLELEASDTSHDDYLNSQVKTAREAAESYLNRALVTRTYEQYLNLCDIPCGGKIPLAMSPIQSDGFKVEYLDDNGDRQEITDRFVLNTMNIPGQCWLKSSASYPTPGKDNPFGLVITYKAGYGAASAVPNRIKKAMLFKIGGFFLNREGEGETKTDEAFKKQLHPLRIHPV